MVIMKYIPLDVPGCPTLKIEYIWESLLLAVLQLQKQKSIIQTLTGAITVQTHAILHEYKEKYCVLAQVKLREIELLQLDAILFSPP